MMQKYANPRKKSKEQNKHNASGHIVCNRAIKNQQ